MAGASGEDHMTAVAFQLYTSLLHHREYCDPVTGRRCSSRYQMETDHIQMRALGGNHASQNLRRLCRAHNQFLAERTLGKKWANHWRTKPRD
jgi:hypothetical protein